MSVDGNRIQARTLECHDVIIGENGCILARERCDLYEQRSFFSLCFLASLVAANAAGCTAKGGDTASASHESGDCEPSAWYADADADGYGAGDAVEACDAPSGYAAEAGDCDDGDPDAWPGATETWYDGVDADCDGASDDDADGDGHDDSDHGGDDCDDADPDAFPGADDAWYDGVDTDCDGADDYDADGDGYAPLDWDGPDCDDADASEPVVVATWGSPSGVGTGVDPLDTIQAGIELATGCVAVEPGTYNENLDFQGKNLAVVGVEGAESTVVDAEGEGTVVTIASGEGPDTLLRGFTLTGGGGTLEVEEYDTPCKTLGACHTIISTWLGGGVLVRDASPTLEGLTIEDNALPEYSTTGYYGECYSGGDPVCTIEFVFSRGAALSARDGGAIRLSHSLVRDNVAESGAIDLEGGADLTIEYTRIEANSDVAGEGSVSALSATGGMLSVNHAIFMDNRTAGSWSTKTIDLAADAARFDNVTVVTNDASGATMGVYTEGVVLHNSILQLNPLGSLVYAPYADLDASYTALYNPEGGLGDVSCDDEGNLCTECTFVDWSDDGDPTNDDLHLDPDSACAGAAEDGSDLGAYGGAGGDDW